MVFPRTEVEAEMQVSNTTLMVQGHWTTKFSVVYKEIHDFSDGTLGGRCGNEKYSREMHRVQDGF